MPASRILEGRLPKQHPALTNLGCSGVNFVRSIIWRCAHCSMGSEGSGWKSRDKAKVSDWLR